MISKWHDHSNILILKKKLLSRLMFHNPIKLHKMLLFPLLILNILSFNS